MSNTASRLRIGEAARRLGMSPELMRAWELRYGVPVPERTEGGLRLYSQAELDRLRAMRDLVADGMAPAEAASTVARPGASGALVAEPARPADLRALSAELAARLDAFDDAGANLVLDELLSAFGAQAVIADVVLPTLARIGDRWASGEVSVAQEHFATTVLRGRLLALARGWDRGLGPRAVLACVPDELHDVGLIAFGLALRDHGWRITYLGQDTPLDTFADTVAALEPAAAVLALREPARLTRLQRALGDLPRSTRLFVGGGAVTAKQAGSAQVLPVDPAEAARAVAGA